METIPLDKIICESNREYTRDEGDDQLLNSIRQYGIIQAPVLRRIDTDQYKVIAGRRRIEAARRLNMTSVNCEIRQADDVDDEEIALTENVNRQEMHPLDEAAAFKRMADNGSPIEEITLYYARSPSAIYKRLRLCGLTDNSKTMFRDQKINITGAALLAELPMEDQDDFYKLYENHDKIDSFKIANFIKTRQRYVIKKSMIACEGCDKRTHNEGNELFEEFKHLYDVCLDADCYRTRWYNTLLARLNEQRTQALEAGLQTDNKIHFSNGALELIYKKAAFVHIDESDKQQITPFAFNTLRNKYEIIRVKDYEFTGETSKKKGACWEVREDIDGVIIIRRVGYKEKPLKEKTEQKTKGAKSDLLTDMALLDVIEELAVERDMKTPEVEKAINKKYHNERVFEDEVEELARDRLIARRVELDKSGAGKTFDYFSLFLELNDFDEKHSCDIERKEIAERLSGKTLKEITSNLSKETQSLFHFLLLLFGIKECLIPSLGALKDIKSDNLANFLFWRYAGVSKDEYRDIYIAAAKEAAEIALESKAKKNKNK